MKILFLGTPAFAVPSLEALSKEFEVTGVITQPDRPAGRGMKVKPPTVKEQALAMGIEVYQCRTREEVVEVARSMKAECAVVVAFGMILPREFIDLFPLGALNLHASLLPKYRGPDPVRRALLSGEKKTGLTVMLINDRMDAGDILSKKEVEIEEKDNALTLTEKLALEGSRLLVKTLKSWSKGELKPCPQDEASATYAPPLTKEEKRLCWRAEADAVVSRVRACYPEAFFLFREKTIKVLEAQAVKGSGEPGEVIDEKELVVACGHGAVRVLEVITPKGRKTTGEGFVRGYGPKKGELLK